MSQNYKFYLRILDFILVWSVSQGIPDFSSRMENGYMVAAGSSQRRVYVIDLVSGDVIKTIETATPTGVMTDEHREVVYTAQYFQRNIVRFCLERCRNNEVVINTGDGQPEHVAVDFSTGNVYFSAIVMPGSTETSFIGVFNSEKTIQRKIITGLNLPRAMALYPSKGMMFWSDYGDNIIERTSMDGTDRTIIIMNSNCVGLAIDYTDDMLYYGDFSQGEVSLASFDGVKIRTIVRDAMIEDVLVNGPHVYYSRLNKRPAIVKALIESGRTVPFLNNVTDIGRIQSIDIVPRDPQPVNEHCNDRNGLCSGLCLPAPEGRTCACQDGVDLLNDGITCEGDLRCPTSIPNGMLDTPCTSYPGETCNFTCNKSANRLPVSNITCLESGEWNQDITILCLELQNTGGFNDMSVIVLSVVVGIVALVILSVIVVCYIYVKRKRKKKTEENGTTMEVTVNYLSLNDGYQTPVELRYDKLQNENRYVNMPDSDMGENYYSVVM